MNILFITRLYYPHIGGVEKHVKEISKELKKKGNKVTIISGSDIKYPDIKLLGLLYIWIWFIKNRKLIKKTDTVHIHDVFIWYLPFRILYPTKRVFTTFHGWEQIWPIPWPNIVQKRITSILSLATIAVGKYIEKYYGVKSDKITFGGADKIPNYAYVKRKGKNRIIYVGRLNEDTGLFKFLGWLDINKKYVVDFCGDGELKKECEKYGTVHGFTDPKPYYKKAEYCVPGGYLAALEALSYDCKLKLFWNNKIKEDYWKMSPFYKLKGDDLKKWARQQTWEKLADEYLDLYNYAE